MKQPSEYLNEAKAVLGLVLPTDAAVEALADAELLDAAVLVAQISRQLDVVTARCAGQIARRSRRELGDAGLAAQQGHLNAESLLRDLTRSTFNDASRRIRVGMMLGDAQAARDLGETSTFDAIAAGLLDGDLALEAADGVLRALAPVADDVDREALRAATETLAREGATCNADELGKMARGTRDTLDRLGVRDREERLRERRSLRRTPVIDGLRRVTLLLDPESDAVFSGAIDSAMSPRLGGPRFTDRGDQERAGRLIDDPRSNEQLALDVLIDLLRIGVDRDDGRILGSVKPALRVTISLDDLVRAVDMHADRYGLEHPEGDTGVAWLEGCSQPVSAATARRILCDAGALPIVLGGNGEPLDLGHSKRFFSYPQRVALANRDGGCRWPGCDRPPSWTEAHHLHPWSTGGKTDLAEGMLLCRRHHLLLHNNGWRIDRAPTAGEFLLTPPATVDPHQTPRPMPAKLPPWLRAA